MIPLQTSLKKSKKRHAIAQAVLGGSGGLGWLWEPLGRSPKIDKCSFGWKKKAPAAMWTPKKGS